MFSHRRYIPSRRSRLPYYLLAVVFACVVFWAYLQVNPFPLYEYRMKVLDEMSAGAMGTVFHDLDNDRIGERIDFRNYNNFPRIEIFTFDNQFVEILKIKGHWFNTVANYLVCDNDQDGFGEIYVLTLENDSLFLNGFEPMGDNGHFLVDRFMDLTMKVNDKYDVPVPVFTTHDTNGDGIEEVIIIISAGYSLFPRSIYRYDPVTGILDMSPHRAAKIHQVSFWDVDGDQRKEFFLGTNASENYPAGSDVPYTDHSGWIFGMTHTLDSLFLVKEFPEDKAYLSCFVKKSEGDVFLYSSAKKFRTNVMELHKYNLKGELLKVSSVQINQASALLNSIAPGLKNLCFIDQGNILQYDDDLNYKETVSDLGSYIYQEIIASESLNSDLFFWYKGNKISITSPDLKKKGEIITDGIRDMGYGKISLIRYDHKGNFTVGIYNSSNRIILIDGKPDWFYSFRFVIYALIFMGFYMFFISLLLLQHNLVRRRYLNELHMVSLLLQSVQNQLTPHFTFNVLNNIGALINSGSNDLAYRYLNDFSDMLRVVLLKSDQNAWMIKDELSFISSYIRMENLRYSDKFSYQVTMNDENVRLRYLPKLMLQTFVENSVRHGLVHKEKNCKLELDFQMSDAYTEVTITDNGIGREASSQMVRDGTGKGILILQAFIDASNKVLDAPFSVKIEDLFHEDGKAAGTRVHIRIPLNYK